MKQQTSQEKKDHLEHISTLKLALEANKAARAYEALAMEISDKRAQSAQKLDKAVMAELAPLKLEKARFVTAVKEKPHESWGEEGIDAVEFLISKLKQTKSNADFFDSMNS